MKIQVLCSTACATMLTWCGTSAAQTASSATAGADTLAEVVVTAERRHTDLQTTPISATVISGRDLANLGVTMVDSLQFATPGAVIDNFGQGNDFNIRGVGKGEHNSQTTVGVVTYRDGVATFPGYFQGEPYYDVANVEILRGPQGTFGGQNATGGAVLVNTNDPVIGGDVGGYVQAQIGNYTDFGLQGAINLPINDILAARFAFDSETRDSFYHVTGPNGGAYNGNPGKVRLGAGRISLLFKPNDALTISLKTDFDYLNFGAYPADPFATSEDLFNIGVNSPQQALDRFGRTILKADYVLPDGITLRSVTGYQKGDTQYQADLDGTNVGNSYFADNVWETLWSEEFNVISPDKGFFTWIFGAYADYDKLTFVPDYYFLIGTPPGDPSTEYRLQGTNPTSAVAAFGQVSFQLTSGLQLQIGGRYTDAKTTNHVQVRQFSLIPLIAEQSQKYTNTSGKVSLNWTVDPDNFLYTFVSTGFRPGGLNVPVGLGTPAAFNSEKLTNYEVGWKNSTLEGHLRTQVDAFYYDYKNFQVTVGYPQFPTFGFELNNPNPTHIYGFEAQSQAVFGEFSLDGGLALMHSALGRFFATDPRIVSMLPCDPQTGPTSASCVDLTGHSQTYAPNFTINLGAQYKFLMSDNDSLTPRLNVGYVGPQWATLFANSSLGDHLSGRNVSGAQLAWQHAKFVTTLYGTNLTDQHYVGALNSGLRFAGPPRQYGIRFLTSF
ncbi:MAG TPA: TonB-dependent receptor [Steroidobacteraceae bacterium]|nr:TonB-dependent receptor [Steroidobacteraceae bacterium]